MMINPVVSVVMPVFNAEGFIKQAIESILQQIYNDFEFIIVNDGSEDNSVEIIKSFRDHRIRLIENEQNQGIVFSLNVGINAAKGKYIARMDADDISLPHRLQQQVKYLDEHPEIGVVGTAYLPIDKSNNPTRPAIFRPKFPASSKWFMLLGSPLAHPTTMYRTQLIKSIGGYSQGFPHAEDYELWTRMCQITKICSIPDICLLYRDIGNDRISTKYINEQINTTKRIRQLACQRLFGEEMSSSVSDCIQGIQKKRTSGIRYDTSLILYSTYQSLMKNYDFSSTEEKTELKNLVGEYIKVIISSIKNPITLTKLFIKPMVLTREQLIKTILKTNKDRLFTIVSSSLDQKDEHA